jgi:hypothetical protein
VRRTLTALTLVASFSAGPPLAAADDERLRNHTPLYRLDRGQSDGPASVREAASLAPGLAPLVAKAAPRARVYGRTARERGRTYLQYWAFYPDNPQDRGIVRTGRHEGDWELVQLRLGADGRPSVATYVQHSWAERCGWEQVERAGEVPIVYVANGSHAAYFSAGVHGRPFPDPDDEARGDGRQVRPLVEPIAARSPAWMTYAGRWGHSRAGIVPGEQSSPYGPAFQPDKWEHPARLEKEARACGSGAPSRPWQWPLLTLLLVPGALAVGAATRAARR